MIPSRGPIQVRLEDTGGPRLQCKPPVQVKILRRPQPVSSTNQTNAAPAAATATAAAAVDNHKAANLDRFAESAFDDVTTDQFSPSFNSSRGQTSEQQNGTRLNYSTVVAANIRRTNNDTVTRIEQRTPIGRVDQTKPDTNLTAPNSSLAVGQGGGARSTTNTNKKPLKTYQERADEYAKARLRILGSAFPENEDLSSTNDADVIGF